MHELSESPKDVVCHCSSGCTPAATDAVDNRAVAVGGKLWLSSPVCPRRRRRYPELSNLGWWLYARRPRRGRQTSGEQINQCFDLIPPALLNCLHDTRLESTDGVPDLLPVDGVPVRRRVGCRTSRRCRCRPICLFPLVGWPESLVTENQREVCPLSRGVM